MTSDFQDGGHDVISWKSLARVTLLARCVHYSFWSVVDLYLLQLIFVWTDYTINVLVHVKEICILYYLSHDDDDDDDEGDDVCVVAAAVHHVLVHRGVVRGVFLSIAAFSPTMLITALTMPSPISRWGVSAITVAESYLKA